MALKSPNTSNETSTYSYRYDTTTYPILGNSIEIARIRKQINFAASQGCITFISGEKGCEKKSIAQHIHKKSPNSSGKLITIPSGINSSLSQQELLIQAIKLAKNGTIYIEDVDDLSEDKKDSLIFLFSVKDVPKILKNNRTRLIISCVSSSLTDQNKQFISQLFCPATPKMHFSIPPLRERIDDLPEHVEHICSIVSPGIKITNSAMLLLKDYSWPGNVSELHSIITYMASFCGEKINDFDLKSLNIFNNEPTENTSSIVARIITKDLSIYKNMHQNIYKALYYLSENYLKDMTLSQISEYSCTSPSHLSYLLRTHLSTSFKSLLNQTRICFANSLINESPNLSITEVCMRSGFSDLSHFEKMFKRYHGCTPRERKKEIRKKSGFI